MRKCAESVQKDVTEECEATKPLLPAQPNPTHSHSCLNGKILKDKMFEKVFIPPYPGDDGVAVGAAASVLFSNNENYGLSSKVESLWNSPLHPYQGLSYNDASISSALERFSSVLNFDRIGDESALLSKVADQIAAGSVVFWFQGR